MSEQAGETIVAIASPPGPGRRGVLRVSGARSAELVHAVWCGAPQLEATPARGLHFARFDDGVGTQPLMLLWMGGPRSFTREDVAEFHLPGSPPLLERALARLVELGARPAAAGEFTRRAFENGRIDLTRAEGVLALVSAQSRAERRSASALLFGGLESRIGALRDGLDALRSLCEASLDFDESDTGHVPQELLQERVSESLELCRAALGWESRRGSAVAQPRVVLSGAPNAGKSSLFNALVTDGSAIVNELAGTTRDVLSGTWELGEGRSALLYDTAGLEQAGGEVAAAAQAIAARFRESADLRLVLVDGSQPLGDALALACEPRSLLVLSKCDLPQRAAHDDALLAISTRSGAGLEQLRRAVRRALDWNDEGGGAGSSATARLERELSARHRQALSAAVTALEEGLRAGRAGLPLDLFAEHLRAATRELDSISGRTTPEDLLDRVFGAFCIGK